MSELLSTNCPHCGAGIQVNPDFKDQLTCRYCGSTFMVKDVVTNINYTTVNNYNDVSQSTYEGLMGKRNVFLAELEKMDNYFSQKKSLYEEVKRIDDSIIPSCIKEAELKRIGKRWMTVLGTWIIVVVSIILSIQVSISIFMVEPSIMKGAAISAIVLIGGIVLCSMGHNAQNREFLSGKSKIGNYLKQRKQCVDELLAYYRDYGDCFLGFEYTFPDKFKKIYEVVKSGKADSIKDAIDILSAELRDINSITDEVIKDSGITQGRKAAIVSERTGLPMEEAVKIINSRYKYLSYIS